MVVSDSESGRVPLGFQAQAQPMGYPSAWLAAFRLRIDRRAMLRRLFLFLFTIGSTVRGAHSAGIQDQDVDAALVRALGWVRAHPASVEDGGLSDLIDEGVLFLMLRTYALTANEQGCLDRALARHMAAIGDLPEFERWVGKPGKSLMEHYHLLLAAHLMRLAGGAAAMETSIAGQARRALAAAPFEHPTLRLTVALLLQRVGDDPPGNLEGFLGASLIDRVAVHGWGFLPPPGIQGFQRRARMLLIYGLVHEVIALTDFGRQPPPAWLSARGEALYGSLLEALRWARGQGEIDLLAEVAVTIGFLGMPLPDKEQAETLQFLLMAQRPDGSWGRFDTPRENKARHAVLTAIGALWRYGRRGVEPGTRARDQGLPIAIRPFCS